jgi:hypothetical protein
MVTLKTEKSKSCAFCRKVVKGRADKLFCNSNCKANYHNDRMKKLKEMENKNPHLPLQSSIKQIRKRIEDYKDFAISQKHYAKANALDLALDVVQEYEFLFEQEIKRAWYSGQIDGFYLKTPFVEKPAEQYFELYYGKNSEPSK